VPALTGRTLVLVDTSASMTHRPYSARSKMAPAKNAAIFGAALALRNPAQTSRGSAPTADPVTRHDVPL
jgi:hypothetical protein